MELVSANTKNYIFLTLTQNNESSDMVRARVSMRRDQAFWEGGNSFIACESFRITSAPNSGGLYYQVVPIDFIMAADRNIGKPPDPAAGGVVAQVNLEPPPGFASHTAAAQGNPAADHPRVGDILTATEIQVKKNPAPNTQDTVSATLSVVKADGSAFTESAFQDFVPRFGRYFGTSRITKNSVLRLTDAHGGGAQSIDMQLTGDPLHTFMGPGLGINGLFVPIVTFPEAATDFAKLAAGQNNDYMGGATIQYNADEGGVISSHTIWQVRAMFGQGSFVYASGGMPVGGTYYHDATYNGPTFTVLAPTGLEVDIAGAKNAQGEWVSTVMFDDHLELAVGDHVSMKINGNIKHGKVTTSPPSAHRVNNHSFRWLVDLRAIPAMLNQPPIISANIMANNRWCQAINKGRPLGLNGYQVHAVGNVVSANSTIDATSAGVGLHSVQHRDVQSIIRGYEQRMIYTPNEFYDMFNQSGDDSTGALTPPWLLQTDENGGFCVKWKLPANETCDAFYISKPMCDSLGLNPYMDYEQLHKISLTDYNATLLDVSYRNVIDDDRLQIDAYMVDANVNDCTINGHTIIPVTIPAVPNVSPQINRNWSMMDQVLYAGRSYYILSVQTDGFSTSESVLQRKAPQIVQYRGFECYMYTHLPEIGQINNTGEVSVESWGTFSMINLVIPNIPFQSMLGGESDARILASLRLPFQYTTNNDPNGAVSSTGFSYYGDLLFNSDSSRSYLRITTDQQLFDCDVEARLIRRDGSMEVMQIPYKGQFQVKLRLLQTQ